MKKRLLIVAALLALAGAGLAVYKLRKPVEQGQIVLYGNVDLRQVSLAFKDSERIARVLVQEGDRVHAGQLLAQLDTTLLALRVAQARAQAGAQNEVLHRLEAGNRPEEIAQARANVQAAQADAQLARQQIDRLEAIGNTTEGRAVSQQDLDAARARHAVTLAQLESARKGERLAVLGPRKEDIAQARAQLEVARASLALLEQQLTDAQLNSPIDAVVRARLLEPGDMASPQRPVFTLAITDPKWVRAYVAETDLARIRPGMAAQVQIDGMAAPMTGRVGYIASVAEFTPKTVQTEELRSSLVYEIRVLTDDPGDHLRLGMPATVRIAAQEAATPAP
ncbi:MAG: HlyD family efflux transporter periplasmic adaptor subunit [Burkholderiaceae bacterium]|jgi:HlyD family secretion protein|nr:HlyD family efflux transporter periplasmic adaptor subunit [Burkholderiaceae bacterium]